MFSKSGTKALRYAKAFRCFSTSTADRADFTHAVIGGGAVGLAIARRLQQRDGVSTVLIEKHGMVGSETSSRNSEVITLVYPALTLSKTHFTSHTNDMNRSSMPDFTTQKIA
jgi:cation diffusion facilitator CzcD-associated flavoprotein CzcO